MSSNDLKGDAMAVFTEHRDTIVAAAALGIVVLFLVLLGGFGAIGGVLFLADALVWLTVLAVVLWLFYRLVTAVERIAAAQERLASSHRHETVTNAADSAPNEGPADGDGSPVERDADEDTTE
jgi:type IV secretory pathway VirB3-like protein